MFPSLQVIRNAKLFLTGKISKNPSTDVILTINDYNSTTNFYHANGRTALIESLGVLHMNLKKHIVHNNQEPTLHTDKLKELQGHVPFSSNVNIENQSAYVTSTMLSNPLPEQNEEGYMYLYIVESIVKKQLNARLGQY